MILSITIIYVKISNYIFKSPPGKNDKTIQNSFPDKYVFNPHFPNKKLILPYCLVLDQ